MQKWREQQEPCPALHASRAYLKVQYHLKQVSSLTSYIKWSWNHVVSNNLYIHNKNILLQWKLIQCAVKGFKKTEFIVGLLKPGVDSQCTSTSGRWLQLQRTLTKLTIFKPEGMTAPRREHAPFQNFHWTSSVSQS